MTRILPLRTPEPPEMHKRAMDNLRFIREMMEAAGTFTAVSGGATITVGVTAFGAYAVSSATQHTDRWFFIWLSEAVLAVAISLYGISLKAHAAQLPLWSEPARKMVFSFAPPMMVGALLTLVFYERHLLALVPGIWMLLYGVAVVAAGTFSVRIIPVMGLAFMFAGALALFIPASYSNLSMAAGFGGLHIIFGSLIARRHGG